MRFPRKRIPSAYDWLAQWVEDYRKSLTLAERATLNAYFQTEEGRQMLRQATAQYNSQDASEARDGN